MGEVLAAAAVASTIYSIYSGERAAEAQEDALIDQKRAQQRSLAAAEKRHNESQSAFNKANKKQVQPMKNLESALEAGKQGFSSTMLTTRGDSMDKLNKKSNSLLGA